MSHPQKLAASTKRKPFLGEWPPVVVSLLLLLLGLAAVATFYASVFAAAHAIAAGNGAGRDQVLPVTLWVCALFLLQGMVPLIRFGISDLPRMVATAFRLKGLEIGFFLLMLAIGAVLVLH